MCFVVSGEVHLLRHSSAGGAVILQRAKSGFVAEASLDQGAYHCDAVAVAPSVVLKIPRQAFAEALMDTGFRSKWIAHLSRELRRVRAQAERTSLRTVPERIAHYIEAEGDKGALRLTQSRKDWAAELGLTHEALYRAMARMKKTGQLRVDGAVLSINPGFIAEARPARARPRRPLTPPRPPRRR